MKKIIILALSTCLSVLAQNPNLLPAQFSVSSSAPSGSFSIDANGNASIGGSGGSLNLVELSYGNNAYANNLVGAAGNFRYKQTGVADAIQFAAGDIFFRTYVSGNAGVQGTPLTAFQIKNGAPNGSMLLDATGNLTIPAIKAATGHQFVCVDTVGKLSVSAVACN